MGSLRLPTFRGRWTAQQQWWAMSAASSPPELRSVRLWARRRPLVVEVSVPDQKPEPARWPRATPRRRAQRESKNSAFSPRLGVRRSRPRPLRSWVKHANLPAQELSAVGDRPSGHGPHRGRNRDGQVQGRGVRRRGLSDVGCKWPVAVTGPRLTVALRGPLGLRSDSESSEFPSAGRACRLVVEGRGTMAVEVFHRDGPTNPTEDTSESYRQSVPN